MSGVYLRENAYISTRFTLLASTPNSLTFATFFFVESFTKVCGGEFAFELIRRKFHDLIVE